MLDQASQAEEPLGICPETGKPVYLEGRPVRPVRAAGHTEGEEKPQNASLLRECGRRTSTWPRP